MAEKTYPAGTHVNRAAELAVQEAASTGKPVRAEFNGTPLTAYPGDTARQVAERGDYERLLYQLKHGIIGVEDL